MLLGEIIGAVMLGKLVGSAIKKSKENSPVLFDAFCGVKNGSSRNNVSLNVFKIDSNGKISGGKGKIFRLHPIPPQKDVPDNFTPYEGADMTCAEADAAGFEFISLDRYHGADSWLARRDIGRNILNINREQYNGAGIPGCVITGWHGKDGTVKVPGTINGRPVLKIEKGAFKGKNIREIYLPDCLLEIGDDAFIKCPSLAKARLSKELVSIGESAFWQCERLENIYLGNVLHIGRCAFGYCSALKQVRLPDMVEYIEDGAFTASGIEKIYWNRICYAGSNILLDTPFWKRSNYIVLGDRIQKCYFRTDGEILIDDPNISCIGDSAFVGAQAEKITFSDKVREIGSLAFRTGGKVRGIKEICAPRAFRFGYKCFEKGQKITVSEEAEFVSGTTAAVGYLHIQENSFLDTDMEKLHHGGSFEKPCVCVMVRNILARVELRQSAGSDVPREILTLSEGGSTLTMDDRVHYTAAEHIPNLGAKKLIVSRNMHTLRSFGSIEDFDEIVIRKPVISAREKLPYRPKKSVTLRFKYTTAYDKKNIDSAVLLYLPNVVKDSEEAQKLYDLYDRCLGYGFNFELYDSEILPLVSSWRGKFTLARMRLEGEYYLSEKAKKRYIRLFTEHRRKAVFTAKKHGDAALLSLLEKLSEKGKNE